MVSIAAKMASRLRAVWDKFTQWAGEKEYAIHRTPFGRFFRLEGSGHPEAKPGARLGREIVAGLTTFATMAYIVAVNADIVSDTGGTCECQHRLRSNGFCDLVADKAYVACLDVMKRDLVTATAAIAAFSSILFGLVVNLPVALAPGMGLNAYFTYEVVGKHGSGLIPYRVALLAVFSEGFIFILLTLLGLRHWLFRAIPNSIKTASGVGIGLFLTIVGLSHSAGLGLVTGGSSTPLQLGGCREEELNANTGMCDHGGAMANPQMWLGIFLGGILVSVLMAFKVRSAIMVGIILVSVISWPRGTSVTYFPDTEEGNSRYDFFQQYVAFHPMQMLLGALQFKLDTVGISQFSLALATFLYVDILDCTATLYSMAKFCGVVEEDGGDFPRSTRAFCTDAFCISVGALLGCPPVTAFVESGAGIARGGRTGLTAILVGLCFLLCLLFAPLLASIPPWATGGTLVIVGCMMMRQVVTINWTYLGDTIPAFVTMALMPLTYSVAYGLIGGLGVYISINLSIWVVMRLSAGRFVPENYDKKETWRWRFAEMETPVSFRWLKQYCVKRAGRNHDGAVLRANAVQNNDQDAIELVSRHRLERQQQQQAEGRSQHGRHTTPMPSDDDDDRPVTTTATTSESSDAAHSGSSQHETVRMMPSPMVNARLHTVPRTQHPHPHRSTPADRDRDFAADIPLPPSAKSSTNRWT